MMTVRFRNRALAELLDFRDHYETLQAGKGLELAGLVSHSLSLVAAFPKMHARGYRGLRHFKVRKFPILVYYRIEGQLIWVIAVLHAALDQRAALKGH